MAMVLLKNWLFFKKNLSPQSNDLLVKKLSIQEFWGFLNKINFCFDFAGGPAKVSASKVKTFYTSL